MLPRFARVTVVSNQIDLGHTLSGSLLIPYSLPTLNHMPGCGSRRLELRPGCCGDWLQKVFH